MLNSKRILPLAILAVALMAGAAFAQSPKASEHMNMKGTMAKEDGKQISLTGEVIDLYCYMNHPDTATGPGHAKCAMGCINKGLPIGFLSNGQVYVITGKDHESVASMVASYAGKQSQITGTLHDHNGVKAIDLISIAPKS